MALVRGSRADFTYFGEHCLRILNKDQKLVPLVLNPVQQIVHAALERQRTETGKVRALILKSRRMGCSTLVAGRFYRYAALQRGVSVGIVAHLQKTTGSLYRIVKRMHEHNPIAPSVGASNIRELVFDKLDSRYSIFSAESGEIGRGEDVSHLHLSEFGFYPKPEQTMAGIVEAVPDRPGTEIIIESTANTPFGMFYDMVHDALAGKGEYQLIFVGWDKDTDNQRPAPSDFTPEQERLDPMFPSEQELMDLHAITPNQLVWRRAKMGGARNIKRFAREYPLTIAEAFVADSDYALINPTNIIKARQASPSFLGDKVLGIDPAGTGKDRFAIAMRQGNTVHWVRTRTKVSFNEAIAWIKAVAEEERPVAINIDAGGGGGGGALCSALQDDPTIGRLIRPVNFGGKSQAKMARPDKPGPANRRSEMWGRVSDWLSSDITVSLPDDDAIQQDLLMANVKPLPNGDWRLESKSERLSPDLGDAIALTFADRYIPRQEPTGASALPPPITGGVRTVRPGSWMV